MLKELQTTKDVESEKSRLPWGIAHQVSISKMEKSNYTMTKRPLTNKELQCSSAGSRDLNIGLQILGLESWLQTDEKNQFWSRTTPIKSFSIPSYFALDHIVFFLFSFFPQVLGIEHRASRMLAEHFATEL